MIPFDKPKSFYFSVYVPIADLRKQFTEHVLSSYCVCKAEQMENVLPSVW